MTLLCTVALMLVLCIGKLSVLVPRQGSFLELPVLLSTAQ